MSIPMSLTITALSLSMLWGFAVSAAEQQVAVPSAPSAPSAPRIEVYYPTKSEAEFFAAAIERIKKIAPTLDKISNDVEVSEQSIPVYAGDLHRRESVVHLLAGAEKQVIEALADLPDEARRSQLSRRMTLGAKRLSHPLISPEDRYIPKVATHEALKQLLADINEIRLQI